VENEMSSVTLDRQERVAIVTLDRPDAMNAIDIDLRRRLHALLDEVARDPDVGTVVLTGSGKAFCAGSDLKRAAADRNDSVRRIARTMLHDIQPILELLTRMEKPVIAAVNGPAVGVGMSLALACDLMVIAKGAYLLAPFTNLGIIADGGASWFLTRRLGYARAMEVLMEAQKLDAQRCLDTGLANRLAEPEALMDSAVAWAAALAARAPLAMALTKRIGRMSMEMGLSEALTLEAELQTFLFRTEDAQEAIAAFGEKRKPVFKGR
jgi:2-(1,2-epoxy-1,2-dihydrophenyl)acetyl-CoA isomerase